MRIRHPDNPNLTLLQAPSWEGLPVQSQKGLLIQDYLVRINDVLSKALAEHRRTCVFRVDLKFPAVGYEPDTSVITRFIGSLKSQLNADACRKERDGLRVYPCTLRYLWVREQHTSANWHYHVAILVNRDRFNSWGRFRLPSEYNRSGEVAGEIVNMADRMRKAWASALGINLLSSIGLVNFSEPFWIDANADDYHARFNELFHWLSYFAKVHTKQYGNRHRNFGCSHN